MAIVHQYTIIYFTLIIHESMSSSINRDLCLETVNRFIDYEWKCDFGLATAKNILQNVTTCPKKCKVRTSDLYAFGDSLEKIDLPIGDKKKIFSICLGFSLNKNFNINCSSWNASEYIIWNDANSCFLKDAHCVHIKNYCVCHCLSGYILVDGKCLKKRVLDESCKLTDQCPQPFSVCLQEKCNCITGYSPFDTDGCLQDNVPVGGFCSLHEQCTGDDNSGICEHGRCTCTEGFKFVEFACKKKNLELNDPCEFTEQCIQPFSVCFHGECKCMNGYSAFDTQICYKDNVTVGGFCSLNEQCTGDDNSGICEHGRCTCTEGFKFVEFACKKKIELDESCELTNQCSKPFSVCLQGKCNCITGYSPFDTDGCLQDNVPVGGFCSLHEQCTGDDNSGICEHGRCTCTEGFKFVEFACKKKNLELNDPCEFTEQCIQPFSVCVHEECKCMNGYSAFGTKNCSKDNVPVGGFCSLHEQCTGSKNSGICEHGRCTCTEGFKFVEFACKKRSLKLNDSCELSEQCTQPFSVCFKEKCKCRNGYSSFDTDSCMKDTIPVGGFCNLSNQCTGSNNSGICENGRCTCAKEFTVTDLACEKSHQNSLGIESSNSQQHDTNIGVTLGSLFGGFILGVIVSAVVTTLMYRRFKLRTRKRDEPDVMFADNRTPRGASGAQISYRNNKKRDVAMFSLYSFAKETPGNNLSEKQDERIDDVYNHLHEQTEQVDDTYAHACAVLNHSTDLSEYSNIHDAATFRPSPSKEGDDYSF